MNCKQAQAALPLQILGELGADQVRLLEEHLRTCADCRAQAAEFEQITNDLAPAEALTDMDMLQLENRVFRGLAERVAGRTGPLLRPASAWVLRVAAGVLIFAAGYVVHPLLRPGPDAIPVSEPPTVAVQFDVAQLDAARWAGHRVSPEGLKIIARGISNLRNDSR
jgi:anti-sigma factor RsiW